MVNLRYLFCFLVLAVGSSLASEALKIEAVKEILEKEHDATPLVDALKIYPKAKRYDFTVKVEFGDEVTEVNGKATEKWVGGKYLVSKMMASGGEMFVQMVVEYDEASRTFRKYVVFDGKLVGYHVGTRIGKTRSISWIDVTEKKFAPDIDDLLSIETHTDESTTWRSIYFSKGAIHHTEEGVATVREKM